MSVADLQQLDPLTVAALSIAGSDSSGGAGLQADLKTFSAFEVFGATAVTAVTAQNTAGVRGVEPLSPELLGDQIEACLEDLPIRAAKTGMLANASLIDVVADAWRSEAAPALVLDPVMVATSGARLLDESAERAMIRRLLPQATLVTPNLPEAAVLAGSDRTAPADDLAARILDYGSRAVLIKDGHGADAVCTDLLMTSDGRRTEFRRRRVAGQFHGTGCALSAAICALLALGEPLDSAVQQAGDWLAEQIASARLPRSKSMGMLPFSRRED